MTTSCCVVVLLCVVGLGRIQAVSWRNQDRLLIADFLPFFTIYDLSVRSFFFTLYDIIVYSILMK